MERKAPKSLDGFQKSEPITPTDEIILAALLQLNNESDPDPPAGGWGLTQEFAETA
jgi:hypothetical protein